MIHFLRKEWFLLFADTKHIIYCDTIPITLICNDNIIIDDVLLYFNNVSSFLHYFPCVTQVFTKYRLSFKLAKYDFFKPRVKFRGHEQTT